MSDHKPMPVQGYTSQPQWKVDLVNINKNMEERVLRHLDDMGQSENVDGRWLAIGRTYIEQAFMAINRAVFQPQRINSPSEGTK